MNNNSNDFFSSKSDAIKNTEIQLKWFYNLFESFANKIDSKKDDISISVPILIEIIMDVDSEINKLVAFHNLVNISRVRQISLYCYYILKRRPIIASQNVKHASNMNEYFCIILLLSGLSLDINNISDNEEYIDFIIYMFKNGELTKDAIYMLAKTLHTFMSKEDN